jgi:hypothetical protein
VVGDAACLEALRGTVAHAGGPGRVLGVYVEMVGERSGLVVPASFVAALARFRAETKIPIVLVETASAYYRSGLGAFASSPLARAGGLPGGESFVPDALVWWTGGQHGFVHVSAPLFVPTPLTFVSTWDGDELSMVQAHHQLRAARKLDVAPLARALDEALAAFSAQGIAPRGLGLHRALDAGDRAEALLEVLAASGLRSVAYPNGVVPITPALDRVHEACAALARAASALGSEPRGT